MAKKRTKESIHVPKAHHQKTRTKTSEIRLERSLIENFVSLQRVLTNLSTKMDSLTTQISDLLSLFELSAKALAKKDFTIEKESQETKEILKKIDSLGEQNKIIARGLTLLHEGPQSEVPKPVPMNSQMPLQKIAPSPMNPSMPPQPQNPQGQTMEINESQGYEKSISTKSPEKDV
jgi:hypothetical protein